MERNQITEKDEKNQASTEADLSTDKFLRETTSKCASNLNISVIDTGIDNKFAEKEPDMTGNGTHVAGIGDISKPSCTIENKAAGSSHIIDNAAEMLSAKSIVDHELRHGLIIGEQSYGKGVGQKDLFSIDVTPLVDLFSGKFDRFEK